MLEDATLLSLHKTSIDEYLIHLLNLFTFSLSGRIHLCSWKVISIDLQFVVINTEIYSLF